MFEDDTTDRQATYISETRGGLVDKFGEKHHDPRLDPPHLPCYMSERPWTHSGARDAMYGPEQHGRRLEIQRTKPGLKVAELPDSGSAENPTYLVLPRYTPQEIEVRAEADPVMKRVTCTRDEHRHHLDCGCLTTRPRPRRFTAAECAVMPGPCRSKRE